MAAQAVEPEARAVWPPARAELARAGSARLAEPVASPVGGRRRLLALRLGLVRSGRLPQCPGRRHARHGKWSANSARTAITGNMRKARRKPRPPGSRPPRRGQKAALRQVCLADPAAGRPRTTGRQAGKARPPQEHHGHRRSEGQDAATGSNRPAPRRCRRPDQPNDQPDGSANSLSAHLSIGLFPLVPRASCSSCGQPHPRNQQLN